MSYSSMVSHAHTIFQEKEKKILKKEKKEKKKKIFFFFKKRQHIPSLKHANPPAEVLNLVQTDTLRVVTSREALSTGSFPQSLT